MQNETRQTTPAAAFGRSSIKRLPPELREAVDQAIADGATIDEITARIRAKGEDCSRSAVGRYAKNMRDLIRQQQETDRTIKAWAQALGERPEGDVGRILIETLQSMVLDTMADLRGRDEPVPTQELARLSHILKRIESHRQAPQGPRARGGEGEGGEGQGGRPISPRVRAGSRRRRSPSSARRWRGIRPRRRPLPAPSRRCRWTRGIPQSSPQSRLIPVNPTQSRIIPANPT